MINVLVGLHPVTRELWLFHTHDGVRTPFTDEEMETIRRKESKAEAEFLNRPFETDLYSGVTGERLESVPVPPGWYVSKGQ